MNIIARIIERIKFSLTKVEQSNPQDEDTSGSTSRYK